MEPKSRKSPGLSFAEKPGFLFRTAFLPAPAQGELIMAGIGSGKGETLRLAKVDGVEHMYFSGFDLAKRSPGGQ